MIKTEVGKLVCLRFHVNLPVLICMCFHIKTVQQRGNKSHKGSKEARDVSAAHYRGEYKVHEAKVKMKGDENTSVFILTAVH